MAMEIGKGKEALVGILFIKEKKIWENRDEGSQICMRGKLKENEENKGLKDKKAFEDQFMAFVSLSFW